MQAKPIAPYVFLALLLPSLTSASAQTPSSDAVKPPPAIPVVLYADPPASIDSVPPPVLAARDALRSDRRLEVLLFNPDSPTFILGSRRAALSVSPDAVATFDQRKAMTQAVGGSFFAVMSRHGRRSKTIDATLYEIAPVARTWSYLDRDPDSLAVDLAAQVETAAAQSKLPAPEAPAPSTTITAPVNQVTVPHVSASLPTTAPPVIAPSASTPPKPSTPTPAPAPSPAITVPSTPVSLPKASATPSAPATPVSIAPAIIAAPVVPTVPKSPPVLAQATTPQVAPTISVTPLPLPGAPNAASTPSVPAVTPPATVPLQSVAAPSAPPVAPPVAPVVPISVPAPAVAPATDVLSPSVSLPATPPPGAVISDDARRLITTGDQQQRSSDYDAAIDTYRQAINLAPRAAEPRLRLAQAFLQAGMRDQAISEARRALTIDPSSQDARDFLTTLGASDADETQIPVNQANANANPKDQTAWIALGDSCWNANKLPDALTAYKNAVALDPAAVAPQARLARFYAAQGDYDQSLTALDKAGSSGYPFALEIIASETENLFGEIDAAEELFERGENTREQCYKRLKAADKAAQGLADFVAKVKPPDAYKLSHLHRQLSTRLLSQDTAGWLSYTETGEVRYKSIALNLEKEAIREMETAAAAERARSGTAAQ